MTRPLILIADAQDPDDASAKSIDRFAPPRRVDELQQQRASEPPMGEGLYVRVCVECGFPFRTDDREACLCPPCDTEDAAHYPDDGGLLQWQQRQFGRGKVRR